MANMKNQNTLDSTLYNNNSSKQFKLMQYVNERDRFDHNDPHLIVQVPKVFNNRSKDERAFNPEERERILHRINEVFAESLRNNRFYHAFRFHQNDMKVISTLGDLYNLFNSNLKMCLYVMSMMHASMSNPSGERSLSAVKPNSYPNHDPLDPAESLQRLDRLLTKYFNVKDYRFWTASLKSIIESPGIRYSEIDFALSLNILYHFSRFPEQVLTRSLNGKILIELYYRGGSKPIGRYIVLALKSVIQRRYLGHVLNGRNHTRRNNGNRRANGRSNRKHAKRTEKSFRNTMVSGPPRNLVNAYLSRSTHNKPFMNEYTHATRPVTSSVARVLTQLRARDAWHYTNNADEESRQRFLEGRNENEHDNGANNASEYNGAN
jgi:hypothetical protein